MSHKPSPTLRLMRQQRPWISASLACLTALWQIGQPLQAADQIWTNTAANLLWSDAGNWSVGLPAAGDNVFLNSPIPGGLPTITLGAGSFANLLTVRDNYTLTGGDLTLTTGGISVERGNTLNLASMLSGSAGLSLTGGGTVRLAAGNNYTGTTTISNGSVVINNQTALGTDASAVVVVGSPTRGFNGGSLVLDGTAGGITISRNLSLQGFGSISDRSAALVSVGNNTLSGTVNLGVSAVNTRVLSSSGNLALTGTLDIAGTAGTTVSTIGGGTNTAGAGNYTLTGALTGTGTLDKAGSGTLILTPSSASGFSGSVRISNTSASGTTSSIRITSANVLGTRTATTTGAVLDLNGGLLEVLMDAPSVQSGAVPANANLYGRANSSTIFVDHSVGGSAINGTLTFGAMAFEENTTQAFTSRNGYNVTIGATPVQGGDNSSTITNNLAGGGLLTFTGAFWSNANNTGNRTMNIGGNGNTLISGNVTASAAAFDHVITKTGTGTLTLTGTAGTLDGALNIQAGAVAVNDFRAINLTSTSNVNIGATTVGGTFNIVGTAPTLANLTFGTARALNFIGTTGGAAINANQTGTVGVLFNNPAAIASGAGTKVVTLGGSNIAAATTPNEIKGIIQDNLTGTNLTSLVKTGAGNWTLSGANTYTGTTTVSEGTLRLVANAATTSTIIADAPAFIFTSNATTLSAGGSLELVGFSGSATTETLGALTPTFGAGTVRLTAATVTPAATNLVFSSLGAVGKGTGINFITSAGSGGTVTLTGVATTTATTLPGNGHFYMNGTDFARSNAGVLVAPVYGTDAGFVNAAAGAATLTAANHNLVTGNITAQTAVSVTSLKLTTNTLALTGLLTVNTGAVANDGGILQTGGATAAISGTGITTGGAGAVVVRSDLSTDVLTLSAPITSTTTGGLTKNGAGRLVLSGNNAQTGTTSINEGTVQLSGTGRLSGANQGLDLRQGATLDLNGVSTGTAIAALNGAGTITNSNATAATLTVGNVTTGGGTFSGVIQDGTGVTNVALTGTTGTLTLSGANTYTGVTTIGTGLATTAKLIAAPTLANIGTASGIGRGLNTNDTTNAASLVFGGLASAGLNYTGTNSVSIDRLFTLNGNMAGAGGQIANSSATNAALVFNKTNAISFGAGATVAQTLTLGGASLGDSRINLQIVDNAALKTSVNKIGVGIWALGAASNTYTGTTTITDGVLIANDGSSLSNASGLLLGATTTSGVLQTTGTFSRTVSVVGSAGTNTVSWNGTTGGGGFAANDAANLTVNLGAQTWGVGGFVGTGGAQSLIFNSSTALGEVKYASNIDLNGAARSITVNDNANTATDFASITGVLSGATAGSGVSKAGGGILQLQGANTYVGNTAVTAGTLVASSLGNSALGAGATSVGQQSSANTAASAITLGNGTTGGGILQYVGAGETSDRMIRLNTTTGANQIHADGAGALVLTNVLNDMTAGAKTLNLRGSNAAGNTITSILADNGGALGITVDGSATWILTGANTYTGTTLVSAGALGIASSTLGNGAGNFDIGSGTVFAYGADRTVSNPIRLTNNTTTAFVGDYNLGFSNTFANLAAANSGGFTNNITAGKMLTFADVTNNSLTAGRTLTINGTGDTIISGNITTSTAFDLSLIYSGTGSLTLGGTGNGWSGGATGGNLTVSSGTLKISNSEVIPHGAGNGNLVITPATGVTATFDLNGLNETINALTANAAGNVIINNTAAATNSTLTIGSNDQASAVGGGGGTFTMQNTGVGSTLSLAKTGTATTNITGTLTYTGSTSVSDGTLNLNSTNSSTSFIVGATGTLKNVGGITTPANVTGVTVAGAAGAAFTGGTLSFANGLGTPFVNLTTLNLGAGSGTAYLELDAGDTGTDTLTLVSPNTATALNTINFLIKDIDLSNLTDYNLLVAPGGGLTAGGATYTFSLAGYTGGSLSVTDTLVKLTTGTLITNTIFWNGGTSPADTKWNTIDGTLNTNFSNAAGTVQETSLPGKGQKIVFVADSVTGGAALNTTLEQSFKVNALEFQQSTTPANTPLSVTIAPGAVSSNSLNISPSLSTDGLNLKTGGSPLVTISAPFVAGSAQTWTTSDSVALTGGSTVVGTAVMVASTTGLRPGMTITGSNIPAGATIVSVDSATTFTLSIAATAIGSAQNFYAAQQLNVTGALTGSGNVTKTGAGKVVLSTASTGYTGTFGVSGGIAEVTLATVLSGVGGTAGSGAPISVNSGGTFYYNNATADTGAGALNYPNPITLNGGTLSAGGNTRFYSGPITASADSTINLRDLANSTLTTTSRNVTLSGVITGAGKITLDSVNTLSSGNQLTGTLTLSNANTGWSGGLGFTRGSVSATNVNALGTGPITASLGRITYGTAGATTFAIPSTQTLTVDGAGSVFELTADASGTPTSDMTVNYAGAITLGSVANANVGLRLFQATDNFSVINIKGGVVLGNNASISTAGSTTRTVTIDTVGISETGGSRVLSINDDVGTWAQTNQRLAINVASTYTGGTNLAEGTLILGHKDAIGTGTLTITAAGTLQADVDLSAGGSGPLPNALTLNNSLIVSGSNNLTVAGNFIGTGADANRTLTNSLTAGTLVIDGATATIGAAANTAARTLTIDGAGNTIFTNALGNGVFAGNALTKSGVGTLTFNGLSATAANNYGGVTTINNGTVVVNNTSPSLTGGLTFGAAATTTPASLDLNGVSATFGGALTMNINSATASTITVDAGQSLTVNNNVQIGATTPAVANTVSRLTLNGGGTFNVTTAAAGTFTVGGSTSTTLAQDTTLDLTALASANINTSTTGTLRVNPSGATNLTNAKATLLLPTPVVADTVATTTLTAGTIAVGNAALFNSQAGQINTITLGTGLTTVNANTINVGTGSRDIGQIIFAGSDGDLIIRAADGISRATAINIGTGGATTGTTEATTNNLVNFSGHDANILVTSLNVGNQARVGNLTSELNFGANDASIASVLDATNVNIGFRTGTATTTSTLTSRVNISGGAVTFGDGAGGGTGVDIGNSTYSGAGAASTIGELNISGGTVTINNSTSLAAAVRLGTNVAAGGGTVTAAINITGGTTTLAGNIIRNATSPRTTSTVLLNGASAILNMGGFSIGSSSAVITLGAQAGTLQNLGELNGGGDLTKTTAGTLTLSGTNTYTGTTQINAGTVELTGGSAILDSGAVALADVAGANLQLNANETIGSLAGGGGTGGNVQLQSNTLTLSAASGSTAYAGIISGSGGSLVKAGGGTQVLSGVNTFTGKTTIANGTLSIASIDAVASNAQPLGTNADLDLGVASTSSGRLLYTGAATTLSKNVNVLGNGSDTIENGGSGLLTLSGTLTKAGTTLNLVGGASGILVTGTIVGVPGSSDLVIGAGTTTLAAANTYNGPTILNSGGTLNINNANAISTGAFTINGGTIDNTSGAAITLATNNPLNINSNFTFTGTNSLNLGTGAVTLDANRTVTVSANTLTVGGAISGAFNLTGAGAGTLVLTGASTYTGTTTAQTGTTISVGGNGSLGDISSGTVVDNGASLALNSVLYTDAEALTINGTGVGGGGALQTTGTSSFAGPITAATNATINNTGALGLTGGLVKDATTLTLAGSGTYNISGTGISGASANSDLIVSAATVNLNVANTYNGPTFIRNGGTINANVANALPTAIARTAIIMDDTGSGSSTLALGSAQSAASLTGAVTTSQINVGASQLTVGAISGSTNFAGTIVGTGGSIVKDGASTQTFSNANTYSGGTTVNDGTLNVTNTTGSATGTGTVTVGTSGTLAGTGTVEAAANNYIYINGTLQVGDSTLGVPVASTLEVKTSGTGSMVLGSASIVKFDLFTGAGLGDSSAISTAADQIRLFGSLDAATTPGSTLLLAYVGAGTFMAGDMWKLFDLSGPGTISGAFNINYSGLGLGPLLAAELNHSTGILSIVTVPEPSRALLYMIGLMGIFLRRRRR